MFVGRAEGGPFDMQLRRVARASLPDLGGGGDNCMSNGPVAGEVGRVRPGRGVAASAAGRIRAKVRNCTILALQEIAVVQTFRVTPE